MPALRAPDASPWRPASGTRPRRCRCGSAPDPGGSPPGGVMVRLGTHLPHPAARLQTMHRSQREGRDAISSMTPAQSTAMSAIGLTPSVLLATLPVHRLARPPFNLVIPTCPAPARSTGTGPDSGASTRGRARGTIWRSLSPLRQTPTGWRSGSPAAPDPLPPAATTHPPRRRTRRPREGRRRLRPRSAGAGPHAKPDDPPR
jgi:hypothetical protein